RIADRIREILVTGPIAPPDPIAEKARKSAFRIFETMTSSAKKGFSTLQQSRPDIPFPQWPVAEKEEGNHLAHLLDGIATQLYFASGAFENNQRQPDGHVVSLEQKRR